MRAVTDRCVRWLLVGLVLSSLVRAEPPAILYEYDDGSGPQQVERLQDVPKKYRKKAQVVEVRRTYGPRPGGRDARPAEPTGGSAIVRCTYTTPGYHQPGEEPVRIQGTAEEVARRCRDANVLCSCDNAERGPGPIVAPQQQGLGTIDDATPSRQAPGGEKPRGGPVYCRRFSQRQLGSAARLQWESFTQVGTLDEVKAACDRGGNCSCSTDPAYFEQPRSCATERSGCVNNDDCCSGRCVERTCR